MDTRRGINLYTEKGDIDRLLIFLAFFLSLWTISGALISFNLNRIVAASFIAASILLISAGIFVIVHGIFRERDLSYLKVSGIRVETTYSLASNNDALITSGINPVTGQAMMFNSKDCWFKPVGFLNAGEKIDVYVDPKKPDRYYMDFEPFMQRINELQK